MSRREKATCPICMRQVTLNDDRSLRAHVRRLKRRKFQEPSERCPGAGQQPLDQGRLPV